MLTDLEKSKKPTLIILMETMVGTDRIEFVRRNLGFEGSFVVDSNMQRGGLAFLWKETMQVRILSSCANFIDAEVNVTDLGT